MAKYFNGKIFHLAIYDRSLTAEEVVYHHQTIKGHAVVATIALVESTLYEFQLNYSAINFSRVGLMVWSIHDVFTKSFYSCFIFSFSRSGRRVAPSQMFLLRHFSGPRLTFVAARFLLSCIPQQRADRFRPFLALAYPWPQREWHRHSSFRPVIF